MKRSLVSQRDRRFYASFKQTTLFAPTPTALTSPVSKQISPTPSNLACVYQNNLKNRECSTKNPQDAGAKRVAVQQQMDASTHLEKRTPLQPTDANALRSLLQRTMPNMALQKAIPNDDVAKQIASRWQEYGEEPIVLLLCDKDEATKTFCRNLFHALKKQDVKVRALIGHSIEIENRWKFFVQQKIELCIATQGIWSYATCKTLLKSMPATHSLFLSHIPLFILDPIATYTPEKKKNLWNSLCTLLHLPSLQ